VEPVSKTSSVVALSITSPVIKRGRFLEYFNRFTMKMRLPIKTLFQTLHFIADGLKLITQELDGVEQDVQSFKNPINRYRIRSKLLSKVPMNTIKEVETEIQLNMVNSMLSFLKKKHK
jgi:hypothetical protein